MILEIAIWKPEFQNKADKKELLICDHFGNRLRYWRLADNLRDISTWFSYSVSPTVFSIKRIDSYTYNWMHFLLRKFPSFKTLLIIQFLFI